MTTPETTPKAQLLLALRREGGTPIEELQRAIADDAEHCKRMIEYLIMLSRRASLFRVTFGMAILLDPRNRLVDPDADTLEHHPDREASFAMATERGKALQFLLGETPGSPGATMLCTDAAWVQSAQAVQAWVKAGMPTGGLPKLAGEGTANG